MIILKTVTNGAGKIFFLEIKEEMPEGHILYDTGYTGMLLCLCFAYDD